MLDDSTMLQLFEARKIVEVGNVSLAAQRITSEELAELHECLQESERTAADPEAFLLADIRLHEIITRAGGNPLLDRFMASISTLGRASRQKTVHMAGVTKRAVEDHRQIVAALEAHDPQAAGAAMLRHLEHVEQMYRALMTAEST